MGSAVAATPFSVEMPLPSTIAPTKSDSDTDYYYLHMRRTTAEIIPGLTTPVLGFNGSFIGPTIRARTGRTAVVVQTNMLDEPTAVHLHGAHAPAASDGHPMDLIQPGSQKTYIYPNRQRGATLWYHDHAHHMEAEHVYRGLAGLYLLEDPAEAQLGLPNGQFDVPIMLRDAQFAADGSMIWTLGDFQNRNTVLVNGRPQPYLRVAARKYRLRLVNASNLRAYQLRLGNGEEVVQIASDGGLLPAPYRTDTIPLWPGERVEVVVDFSKFPIGTQLVLENTYGDQDSNRSLMRFDVTWSATDDSTVPAQLAPAPELPPATYYRTISLGLNPATFQFQIDGKSFDPNRVDAYVRRGATEIWQVTNLDTAFGIPHDFHIHLVQFKVLDRNGAPPGPGESGWKDTVVVNPGETVRLQATFADYKGRFVYHCHLIDHSSEGMMAQMEVL
ncbi:multicopper oxidase family protein [Micromonospora yasonensis]|uniref:multicopper oxidase family protein n=1 Tax=Micromonospora yasonensis TaxID=1128667 RepID=UPI002230F5D1|nr:multicopper oxidase family protein [Micromonospora yasonensis]MCW3842786.1 multicopper oxidase family protein [Micromonospora yasonensis]